MKGIVLWVLGASAAFLATAGAFLLLASLGSPPETNSSIPPAEPAAPESSAPALVLDLPEERLVGLERVPNQSVALDVVNGGAEALSGVELTLNVASSDAARPNERNYRRTVETLAPGEAVTVKFESDLSPPSAETHPTDDDTSAREALEFSAAAPGVASAVKTAVLAPS